MKSLLVKFVRAHLRSGVRGQTRLTQSLAERFATLHRVPVEIVGLPPIYVDMRAGYSHWLLEHSPHASVPNEMDEERVVRHIVRAGDAVFDIGANIGWYTVLLSQLVGTGGTVYSFEPNAALLPNLELTVASLPNATLHAVALSDEQGDATFYVPEDHQTASLADWTHGRVGATREITCRQQCLDDLIDSGEVPRPAFIKCDTEGAELKVFGGGRKMLDRSDAPIILFEANVHNTGGFGFQVSDAMEFLGGLPSPRFRFYRVTEAELPEPIKTFKGEHANILAVPEARRDRWAELS